MFSAVRAKYVHVQAFKDNLIATKFYLECSVEINLWMSNFWRPLSDCQNEILKSFVYCVICKKLPTHFLKSTAYFKHVSPHLCKATPIDARWEKKHFFY
jgi:hypothetical protein